MNLFVPRPPTGRQKLGLSLAGGGFRASLFHIGVLHRLAEMDVLRYVEVLSTVSGGSIVGALYVLMLKERLDANPLMSRNDYKALVEKLQGEFVAGVQQDPLARLFMNPFGMLSVLTSHDSLGRRMGRIYQRRFYQNAVNALNGHFQGGLSNFLWPGWMPLRQLLFTRKMPAGLEAYNGQVLEERKSNEGKPSDGAEKRKAAIPEFIMNATSLNSGSPFRLSCTEIGDPRLGYFRYDEIDRLIAYKTLSETLDEQLDKMIAGQPTLPKIPASSPEVIFGPLEPRDAELAKCWRACSKNQSITPIFTAASQLWPRVSDPNLCSVLLAMCRTNFGRLRQLKLPAWYIRKCANLKSRVTGGLNPKQHRERFNQVLREVEPEVSLPILEAIADERDQLGIELLDFAIALYYLRSAERMSDRIRDDFEKRISVATAVAASANFPPVFPPLILLGIYDDTHVARLGLSDGGVFDNMGITTLAEEGCTHIIASDTGAPFDLQQRVSSGYVGMIGRLPDILMEDVAEQQRTQLRNRARLYDDLGKVPCNLSQVDDLKKQYGLEGLAFFSIDSLDPPVAGGTTSDCDYQTVAHLRTDLDAFGDFEVAALINTGYHHADNFVRKYFDQPYKSNFFNCVAKPPCQTTPRYTGNIARVLEIGHSLLFRTFKLRFLEAVFPWIFAVFVFAGVLLLSYFKDVSLQGIVGTASSAILRWLEDPFPPFDYLSKHQLWFGSLACVNDWAKDLMTVTPFWKIWIVIGVLLFVKLVIWPPIAQWFANRQRSRRRKVRTLSKWARAFVPSLLALLRLTPVWIAVAACLVGCVSYLFGKVYLRATRMD